MWGTIQFPDLNGDGKADICARTTTGVDCGLSNGTNAFAVTHWLDQFTDANGWRTDLSYGATLQTPNLNVTGLRGGDQAEHHLAAHPPPGAVLTSATDGPRGANPHCGTRRVSHPWAGTSNWYNACESALPIPTVIRFDEAPLL